MKEPYNTKKPYYEKEPYNTNELYHSKNPYKKRTLTIRKGAYDTKAPYCEATEQFGGTVEEILQY